MQLNPDSMVNILALLGTASTCFAENLTYDEGINISNVAILFSLENILLRGSW